ncbi:hypothetical protein H5410_061040 [Solanum commersonii]|uniref:Uncharacterized protein n=1 Tax=Solanum commersonii TaxID=4109 RepID=A0A9J5W6W0_SOLCO|nr:hypothetical protein H5410_061040 [Solanum commersonii]
MRPSMRPLKPDSPQKTQQMARPFEILATRLYAALADYPKLQVNTLTKLISQNIEQESTSFSVQTKESYPMKAPETVASLINTVYLQNNFVNTDNPLKTQRYYKAILVDT